MHTVTSMWRTLALGVIISAVMVFASLTPALEEKASAADTNIELQFFQLGPGPKWNWTDSNADTMMALAEQIWELPLGPGITLSWPKDGVGVNDITPLADPNLDPPGSNDGDVKVPPKTEDWRYVSEHYESQFFVTTKADDKDPLEVSQVCGAALRVANPGQLPVILIQDFIGTNNSEAPILGITVHNPPTGGKGPGVNHSSGGPGSCILIDRHVIFLTFNIGIVLAHELGHAMCLPHNNTGSSLMHSTLSEGGTILNDDEKTQQPAGFLCTKAQQKKAVGGIAELDDIAATPLETDGSSGGSAGVLAGAIAGAVLAGSVTLGGAAWFARRRLIGR